MAIITTKDIGDYDYIEDYSCIDLQEAFHIDDAPELLEYEPLYENKECDY